MEKKFRILNLSPAHFRVGYPIATVHHNLPEADHACNPPAAPEPEARQGLSLPRTARSNFSFCSARTERKTAFSPLFLCASTESSRGRETQAPSALIQLIRPISLNTSFLIYG
jgi:hypothetical protein